MPAPMVRKTIWLLVAALAVAAVIVLTLPWLASTQINRARITQELGEQSGFRVTLGAAPEIRLWPTFHVVLRDVAFYPAESTDSLPAMSAETITADISAWGALQGKVEFSDVELDRPVLRVTRRDGMMLPHMPSFGRLKGTLDRAVSSAPLSGEAIGLVHFTDGRVILEPDETELLTNVTGSFEWQAVTGPASLNASGVWRGETVSLAAYAEKPIDLIRGGKSAVTASMRAEPLSGEFKGTVSTSEGLAFEGQTKLSTPSMRAALEWTGATIAPGSAIGAISLSGNASGDRERIRVDNASLTVGSTTGVGALEVAFVEARPAISGTLAFETIDIGSFLAAFSVPADGTPAQEPMFDLRVTDQFALDLRLSASRATGGPIALDDVAATVQIRPGLAAFDISDAHALGGQIQTSFRVDRKPEGAMVEMRFNATDIDWAALAEAAAWTRHAPRGRGSLSITLRGPATSTADMSRSMTGTITGKLGPGRIEGLDVPKAMERAAQGGFFPLSDIGGGALPFDGVEFKASLLGGAARIETARAWNQNFELSVSGVVPYVGRSLALSGTLKPLGPDAGEPRHFFVGGSWNSPYVAPMLPPYAPE